MPVDELYATLLSLELAPLTIVTFLKMSSDYPLIEPTLREHFQQRRERQRAVIAPELIRERLNIDIAHFNEETVFAINAFIRHAIFPVCERVGILVKFCRLKNKN